MIAYLKNWAQSKMYNAAKYVSSHPYDPRMIGVREVSVEPSSISCFSLSANNIKLIRTNHGIVYFREMTCRTPYRQYLSDLIDDYLFLLHNERIVDNFAQSLPIEIRFSAEVRLSFENYVNSCRRHGGFYQRFGRMKDKLNSVGYSVWNPQTTLTRELLAHFGFEDIPDETEQIFPDFVAFACSGIEQYERSAAVGLYGMDSYCACRTLATKVMAEALGLERLIAEAEVVQLCAGEKRMYGVLCRRCPGTRAKDALWAPSPSLQRDLADMQLLDALCYQKDHWINNYNVEELDGRAVAAKAFDNDNVWTFFPAFSVSFASGFGGAPLLRADGQIRLPHISAETAERIRRCDVEKLMDKMSLYLNWLQLVALRFRIWALRRAIERTAAVRADFLLDDSGWNEETLRKELSGECGNTYTFMYATTRDCCRNNAMESDVTND